MQNPGKKLTATLLNKFANEIDHDQVRLAGRTIAKNGFLKSSEDPAAKKRNNMAFSIEVKTDGVTDQKRSGRCWLFAMLNVLRQEFTQKYHVKDFELSQNYSFFWDRLGRANLFLQRIIASADQELTDRRVQAYLAYTMDDGGEWDNAAAVVAKYGVVPNYVMPDTFNTMNTAEFDQINSSLQRKDALILRKMIKEGASIDDIEAKRQEMLGQIYHLCVLAFGEPPKKFNLEYRDNHNEYHQDLDLTPQKFYQKYIGVNLDDYVELVDYPDHEYNHVYWNELQDNVAGGYQTEYVNVDFKYLQQAVLDQLKDGHLVWFGCDVDVDSDARKLGYLDDQLYHPSELTQIDFQMNKGERLATKQGSASHCMAITGVNLVNGKPNRYKVENSWGEKIGSNGYLTMTQSWFEKYCFQVVANKRYLPREVLDVANSKPIRVEPWDTLY